MNSADKPEIIEVIIVHGKDLVGRKPGLRSFSCVFGVGNKKFTTENDLVSNGNPKWNEEAVIPIKMDCKDDLIIKVMENNKKIGKIKVPLTEIPIEVTKSVKILPLIPAKNCPNSSGQIYFKCWVTKTYFNFEPKKSLSSSLFKISKSHKYTSKLSIDWSSLNIPIDSQSRKSDQINQSPINEPEITSVTLNQLLNVKSMDKSESSEENSFTQEIAHVTAIKPNVIRADKKEKIAIHGTNFGSSVDEILQVEIGEKSILSKIIYHSSTLIFATFEANTLEPTEGVKIIITNKTNLKGKCDDVLKIEKKQRERKSLKLRLSDVVTNPFTSETTNLETDTIVENKAVKSLPLNTSATKDKNESLKIVNSELRKENEDLKKDIDELREKFNQLLYKVMMESPDILEIL